MLIVGIDYFFRKFKEDKIEGNEMGRYKMGLGESER